MMAEKHQLCHQPSYRHHMYIARPNINNSEKNSHMFCLFKRFLIIIVLLKYQLKASILHNQAWLTKPVSYHNLKLCQAYLRSQYL